MRRLFRTAVIAFAVSTAFPVWADYKPYPGAKIDPEIQKRTATEMEEEFGPEAKATALTTADAFEKVLAFYQALGTEFTLPEIPGMKTEGYERDLPSQVKIGPNGIETVSSGVKVKQAFIILDAAADIEESRDWLTITNPMILEIREEGDKISYGDIRKVTAIVRVQKK